jgi:hypothetical protein
MNKLVTGDGRTHITSPLMRESLVDRRVTAKTHSDHEVQIMPDVLLISIGGQSIFDRGKDAMMPLVEEIAAIKRHARRWSSASAAAPASATRCRSPRPRPAAGRHRAAGRRDGGG